MVVAVLAIGVDHGLRSCLPAPLREFLAQEHASSWSLWGILVAGAWLAVNLATLLAWIGLLNSWKPARAIYLWAWVGALLLLPLETAWVLTPIGYALDTAATLVGGALLAVLYFSEAGTAAA